MCVYLSLSISLSLYIYIYIYVYVYIYIYICCILRGVLRAVVQAVSDDQIIRETCI